MQEDVKAAAKAALQSRGLGAGGTRKRLRLVEKETKRLHQVSRLAVRTLRKKSFMCIGRLPVVLAAMSKKTLAFHRCWHILSTNQIPLQLSPTICLPRCPLLQRHPSQSQIQA